MLNPVSAAIGAEYDKDEEEACEIEASHQQRQRPQGADTVPADGERHGAARSERRKFHERVHHCEENMGACLDELMNELSAGAHVHHGIAEENGDEQDLQQIARAGECVEKCRWNDVQDEVSGVLARGALCVIGYGVRVQRPRVDVEPCARAGRRSRPSNQ